MKKTKRKKNKKHKNYTGYYHYYDDIIHMETDIVLTDKDGNIIEVRTQPPDMRLKVDFMSDALSHHI